jgi:hypothetical protein
MTVRLEGGPWTWGGGRDDDGYREYTVTHLVESDVTDGPPEVLACPGLPAIGSFWNFTGSADGGVWCWPWAKAEYHQKKDGDPHCWWTVEQKFSNKTPTGRQLKTCLDEQFDNPLLEPQKVSGSFLSKQKEAYYDKDGNRIQSTSFEPLRGEAVTFDETKATVKIDQNVAVLGLATIASMMNCVNSAPLWGMAARCVKLSRFSWERKIWGTCAFYYTRSFEFDIDAGSYQWVNSVATFVAGFDRYVLDEGTKALAGKWLKTASSYVFEVNGATLPDYTDPNSYARYTDKKQELSRVLLDSNTGLPAECTWQMADDALTGGTAGAVGSKFIQKYTGANFLQLGIPVSF